MRERFASSLVIIRANRDVSQRFIYYVLSGPIGQELVKAHDNGSAQPNLSVSAISRFPLPLPSLKEQQAIACILGALDDKIELNRRMNRTLEGIARALFKSWFVDFDPVRDKAAGQPPFGLDPALANLFPDSFEDSEMGEIPNGWETGSVLEVADLLSGGTPKTSESGYWGGTIPWASAADVSQCGEMFLIDTERTITQAGLDNSATQIIPAFASVVVARGATTGRMTMFGGDIAMNQTCYALRTKYETPRFLYFFLQHEIDGLVQTAHGSVFDTITTATFRASEVVLPAKAVAEAFDRIVSPLAECILANLYESRTLAALRDALLPKLISGELRVPDAERIVGRIV